jgi:hypothetical protein
MSVYVADLSPLPLVAPASHLPFGEVKNTDRSVGGGGRKERNDECTSWLAHLTATAGDAKEGTTADSARSSKRRRTGKMVKKVGASNWESRWWLALPHGCVSVLMLGKYEIGKTLGEGTFGKYVYDSMAVHAAQDPLG